MAIVERTEYILMNESTTVFDENNIARYDMFSYPINNFTTDYPIQEYYLTEKDIYRFDLFTIETYGSVSFYKKFLLWYNNTPILTEDMVGNKILVPNKLDLDLFFTKNLK